MSRFTTGFSIFTFTLCLYVFTMGGRLYSPDEEVMFRTTESLVERGTTAIPPLEGFATRKGKDGNEYAQYGVGQSALAIPFYLAGKALSSVVAPEFLSAFRTDTIQYHDHSLASYTMRFAVSFYGLFLGAFTALLIYWLARSVFRSERVGIICALLYAGCTVAWPQSRTFFSEATAAFFLFLGLFFLMRYSASQKDFMFLASGSSLAGALLTRVDSAVAFPALGLLALYRVWPVFNAKALYRLVLFILPIVLAFSFIASYNAYRFGSASSTGYEDQENGVKFSTPMLPGLYGQLLSPGKGLLVYSPVLILLLWALPRFLKKHPDIGWTIVGVAAGYLAVMSKWQNWAGGWCWGPRHIFQITCFLIVPLGILLDESERVDSLGGLSPLHASFWRLARRFGWLFLIVVSVGLQGLGCSASFMDALSPLQEYERQLSLWFPGYVLPGLHWDLIYDGKTDLWWIYFLNAPLGLWRLLALLPPLGILFTGLALLRRVAPNNLKTRGCRTRIPI